MPAPHPQPLHPDRLTWAVLLGQWVDFAQSALALPPDGDGGRMRASVPDVVMLQAVWFSLQALDELDPAERSLGLDRAGVLIDRHARALRERWGDALPPGIAHLLADTEAAQATAEMPHTKRAVGS